MYGMQEMLGFAADLALSVTILGLKTSIDLTTMKMSIGQTDPRTDGPLSELFGTAPGLSSHEAHNKFEVDGSFSRIDAYWANGNTDHFTSDHWKKYRQLAVDQFGGLMTMDFVGVGRSMQYNECRNTNPECQWTLVEQVHSYAAQGFVSSTMASADEDGNPSPPDIKSLETFFGIVEGPNGTYSRTHGKLPAGPDGHWYRRATPLTFLEAFGSLTETFLVHPTPFGRNNGDLGNWDADLTNLQNVEEANVLCYVLQRTRDPKDSRYASNSVVNAALGVLLHNSLQPLFSQLSCP
ncbi:hypothetical protein CROQUDRAFT_654963 [Cronartium quercuum f. sp. fusiforme G11]|uniref:Heme haloperoxidase family profile domain-containing protein n=1 Tax=Cronartium quercuum f. sp. fusiforme G11 TaxID=708437 RepID=A0A9P6TF62_9BASI|nr:hypothetical protein CROQUDRAFT_654963 [Cronartium quercuum f. sp. fusiforme G11]